MPQNMISIFSIKIYIPQTCANTAEVKTTYNGEQNV